MSRHAWSNGGITELLCVQHSILLEQRGFLYVTFLHRAVAESLSTPVALYVPESPLPSVPPSFLQHGTLSFFRAQQKKKTRKRMHLSSYEMLDRESFANTDAHPERMNAKTKGIKIAPNQCNFFLSVVPSLGMFRCSSR